MGTHIDMRIMYLKKVEVVYIVNRQCSPIVSGYVKLPEDSQIWQSLGLSIEPRRMTHIDIDIDHGKPIYNMVVNFSCHATLLEITNL